jgi:predicted ATPase/DNA-binding winged helix-turn-helix (wHTH) protein
VSDDQPLRFGRFEIRPRERQLIVNGSHASLGARAFDLLLALAARPGQLLTKDELMDTVWPNLVVEENNLQVQVSTLRKLLGSDVVATIPGRGYRFTASPVSADAPGAAGPAAPAALGLAPAAAPRSAPQAALLKTNLPARLPALIGRDDDLLALDALLQDRALVTVVGTGGIGKTLLAQHVLHRQQGRHTHGVCFVELAGIADPRQVVGAVAAALGVQAGGGQDDDSVLAALVQAVEPLTLLIALDNAEHLVEEVARVANALHAGASRVTLLVTSQAPLQLGVEHVYRVGTLALPDDDIALSPDAALRYGAVALFAERARQVDRRFALDESNVGTAVALCRRLDGLPLAIGLAAARVPLLGVEGLATALGERLKLLTSGARDASARHRTLRAALEWSHGLLDEREQVLFRRLGIVVGSASLELVRRIAVDDALDEWSALDALSVLVDRSLVVLDSGADDAAPRYRLLESPRAYATERLDQAGETPPLRERHARAMAARFERAYDDYFGGVVGVDAWRRDLEPDLDNARAAFAWGVAHDPTTAAALTPMLAHLLVSDKPSLFAMLNVVEPLLLDERVPASLRARAWSEGARQLLGSRNIEWESRALALCRETGDARGRYLALAALAWTHGLGGDAEAAAAAVQEMDAAHTPPPVSELAKRGEMARGALAIAQDRWEDVLRHFRRCCDIWVALGGHDAMGMHNVIGAEMHAGLVDDAVRDGEALLAQLQGTREVWRLVWLGVTLTAAWLRKGELAQARVRAAEAWPHALPNAFDDSMADHCALLAALEGRPRQAARLLGYADARHAANRDSRQPSEAQSAERDSIG